ncbi:uncharacterized protein LOC105703160 [Orussus abietinus]|uniref:uncharacterized protein LOC105703160 n=1 Tax=Orussus abietinus TaxID=222816 RepID=UPI000626D5C7|nr:uncharacterized protein LOC105703160 [Orussus abietinus]
MAHSLRTVVSFLRVSSTVIGVRVDRFRLSDMMLLLLYIFQLSLAIPLPDSQDSTSVLPKDLNSTSLFDPFEITPNGSTDVDVNPSSPATGDLYVIRAVVYEVGILTSPDNTTDESTEKHEELNISLFDPPRKEDGVLDLSKLFLPQLDANNQTDSIHSLRKKRSDDSSEESHEESSESSTEQALTTSQSSSTVRSSSTPQHPAIEDTAAFLFY